MASVNAPLTWDEFASRLSEILGIAADDLDPEARLVEDLGADSVALAEIVAFLLLDCGMESLAEDLDRRAWNGITLAQVYREYTEGV